MPGETTHGSSAGWRSYPRDPAGATGGGMRLHAGVCGPPICTALNRQGAANLVRQGEGTMLQEARELYTCR